MIETTGDLLHAKNQRIDRLQKRITQLELACKAAMASLSAAMPNNAYDVLYTAVNPKAKEQP